MFDGVTVGFYVLVLIAFIQIDRRLHDIVKALKTMTRAQ
jgi:hypothetical protein